MATESYPFSIAPTTTIPFSALIVPPEFNCRHSWEDVQALVHSLCEIGLRGEFATVRATDQGFLIVAGFRRWLAASYLMSLNHSLPEYPGGRVRPAAEVFALVPVVVVVE